MMLMEIKLDYTKSAQKNAEDYFGASKKAKKKLSGAENAVKELESKLSSLEKMPQKKKRIVKKANREWYEKFNWFFTSNGLLAIGGSSADENEELNSKYFEDGDLFFHADIFGASVVILKKGSTAPQEVKEEVAQFAASYSKAWSGAAASMNVYSLKREQVTKSRNKGSLGKGSFLLVGEREWYKNIPLILCAFTIQGNNSTEQKLEIAPEKTCSALKVKRYIKISGGNTKKSDAAKYIAKYLAIEDMNYVMQHLPTGPFSLENETKTSHPR